MLIKSLIFTVVAILAASLIFSLSTLVGATFSPSISQMGTPVRVASYNQSTLYEMSVPGYDYPYLVANISGPDRYSIGYSWNMLLAKQNVENFNFLMDAVFKSKLERDVFILFAIIQYELFVIKGLPTSFQQELAGVRQAFIDQGFSESKDLINVGLVLSSFPGNVEKDILWLILDELHLGPNHYIHDATRRELLTRIRRHVGHEESNVKEFIKSTLQKVPRRACSHWGAWGDRTLNGQLFTGRNLDWLANSGIAKNKLLTIFHPPKGEVNAQGEPLHSHLSIGFAGLLGSITGMSSQGITVHESGDDNKMETLTGFSWTLRLRSVMEQAKNMKEAKAYWEATNNTMGINHGIGSGADRLYMILETKATYTAYFLDNDPREANAFWPSKDPATECPWVNGQAPCNKTGFPLKQANWRTNHGYDPIWLQTCETCRPNADSFTRYMLLHDTFKYYESIGNSTITVLQAVNLTAIAGDKGGNTDNYARFLTCPADLDGANIVSATFDPSNLQAYIAFENGRDSNHTVAGCNNYGKFDLKMFL